MCLLEAPDGTCLHVVTERCCNLKQVKKKGRELGVAPKSAVIPL